MASAQISKKRKASRFFPIFFSAVSGTGGVLQARKHLDNNKNKNKKTIHQLPTGLGMGGYLFISLEDGTIDRRTGSDLTLISPSLDASITMTSGTPLSEKYCRRCGL
jgi:hypothetical protein